MNNSTENRRFLLVKISLFLSLAFLTGLLFIAVKEHLPNGQQLLQDNNFSEGAYAWKINKGQNSHVIFGEQGVLLTSADPGKTVSIHQRLQVDHLTNNLYLIARVRALDIVPGEKGWDLGRVLLVQYIDGKPKYNIPHVLTALQGTVPWQNYERVFTLSPMTSEIRITLQLSRCTGTVECGTIELYNTKPNGLYPFVKWGVLGAWLLFLVFVFRNRLIRVKKNAVFIAAIVVLAAIVIGTTMPEVMKNNLKKDIYLAQDEIITSVLPSTVDPITDKQGKNTLSPTLKKEMDVTKMAHFVLFALLALLLLQLTRATGIPRIVTDLFILACATEFMQLFIDGRTALIRDVGIDMAGCCAGILIYFAIQRLKLQSSLSNT